MAIVIFAVGLIVGFISTTIYYRCKHVGTLRIDQSDPSDGAYFFLEIESGKAKMIQNHNLILLTVSQK